MRSPLDSRQLVRRKVPIMTEVACFCGCVYSFVAGAGACPRCGEVAAVTAEPEPDLSERGRPGEPVLEKETLGFWLAEAPALLGVNHR